MQRDMQPETSSATLINFFSPTQMKYSDQFAFLGGGYFVYNVCKIPTEGFWWRQAAIWRWQRLSSCIFFSVTLLYFKAGIVSQRIFLSKSPWECKAQGNQVLIRDCSTSLVSHLFSSLWFCPVKVWRPSNRAVSHSDFCLYITLPISNLRPFRESEERAMVTSAPGYCTSKFPKGVKRAYPEASNVFHLVRVCASLGAWYPKFCPGFIIFLNYGIWGLLSRTQGIHSTFSIELCCKWGS